MTHDPEPWPMLYLAASQVTLINFLPKNPTTIFFTPFYSVNSRSPRRTITIIRLTLYIDIEGRPRGIFVWRVHPPLQIWQPWHTNATVENHLSYQEARFKTAIAPRTVFGPRRCRYPGSSELSLSGLVLLVILVCPDHRAIYRNKMNKFGNTRYHFWFTLRSVNIQ